MNKFIILLSSIFIITLVGCGGGGGGGGSSSTPSAGGITAIWTASVSPDVASYRIDYGTSIGDHSVGSFNVGNVTTYTTSALPAGYYCFVVVAIDNAGNESSESNEQCKDVT